MSCTTTDPPFMDLLFERFGFAITHGMMETRAFTIAPALSRPITDRFYSSRGGCPPE